MSPSATRVSCRLLPLKPGVFHMFRGPTVFIRSYAMGCVFWVLALCALTTAAPQIASAEVRTVRVAVAANFLVAAKRIAERFGEDEGAQVVLTSGATGHLYAQITQGAPFDVFLAADQQRPERAVRDGFAIAGTRRTYAVGQLVLYVPGNEAPKDASVQDLLLSRRIQQIAIANPGTAPYGAAAKETLHYFGVYNRLQANLVRGRNVLQVLQFVVTGNAQAGFVAKTLVLDKPSSDVLELPPGSHTAIRQDGVRLAGARTPKLAQAFLDFLASSVARDIIRSSGYLLPKADHPKSG